MNLLELVFARGRVRLEQLLDGLLAMGKADVAVIEGSWANAL